VAGCQLGGYPGRDQWGRNRAAGGMMMMPFLRTMTGVSQFWFSGLFRQVFFKHQYLKVYMELGSYFLFLQEQIKDIIIMHYPSLALEPT
jgi:hypothetical protein